MTSFDEILYLDSKEHANSSGARLYTLSELSTDKVLDIPHTILVPQEVSNLVVRDVSDFARILFGNFCENVSFADLLVTGSIVPYILTGTHINERNFDVYLYGIPKKESGKNRIDTFLKDLHTNVKLLITFDVVCYNDCIVVLCQTKNDNVRVRIFTKLFASISEILHTFDLGFQQVGYSNNQLYFTGLAKFAYEHIANVFSNERRSATYELSLKQSAEAGFKIIMPYLNRRLLKKEYFKFKLPEVCQLELCTIIYNRICSNNVYILDIIVSSNKPREYVLSENIDIHNLRQICDGSSEVAYATNISDIDAKDWKLQVHDCIVHPTVINSFYENIEKSLIIGNAVNLNIIYKSFCAIEDIGSFINTVYASGDAVKRANKIQRLINEQKTWITEQISGLDAPCVNIEHYRYVKNSGSKVDKYFRDYYVPYSIPEFQTTSLITVLPNDEKENNSSCDKSLSSHVSDSD